MYAHMWSSTFTSTSTYLNLLYQNLFPGQKILSVNQTSCKEQNLAFGVVIYGELTGSCSPTRGRWRGRGGVAYFSPETLWRSVRVIEKEIELHVFTTHQE